MYNAPRKLQLGGRGRAPRPGVVVSRPGPGVDACGTTRPTISRARSHQMPEQRCPQSNKITWHRGHERYIQSQSSMSLEQETSWAADGRMARVCRYDKGERKVNYRAALRIIGRLIRLLRRDHKSVGRSSQSRPVSRCPLHIRPNAPTLPSYRSIISLCLSACRSCSRNMRTAPAGTCCTLVGRWCRRR